MCEQEQIGGLGVVHRVRFDKDKQDWIIECSLDAACKLAQENEKLRRQMIRLGWDTWNDVCDFVPAVLFRGGVYLDDATLEALPDGNVSNTMGLKVKTDCGVVLAVQGDYIIRSGDGLVVCRPVKL